MILLFFRCGTPRGRDGARHDLTQAHRGLVSREAGAAEQRTEKKEFGGPLRAIGRRRFTLRTAITQGRSRCTWRRGSARACTTLKTRVISPRLLTRMTSSQAQREHPLITHAHLNVGNRYQKEGIERCA